MTTAQFEHANEVRTAHGEPFANPRNAAAGTLRAKDRAYTVPMTFFGYALLPLPGTEEALAARLGEAAHSELMARCGELGVNTTAVTVVPGTTAETAEQVLARVKEIAALRAELPFRDRRDSHQGRPRRRSGGRRIRFACAALGDRLQAARRGEDHPAACRWSGTWAAPASSLRARSSNRSRSTPTITYATLHNPADITRRDLRLGDHVMVHRAGDVIPRVEAPVAHLRTGEERPIVFPRARPRAGSAIDTSEQRWRCENGRNCHLVAALSYAAGRDQLDIEGLGHTRVVQLVEAGLVADLADVFALTRGHLLALERMGETSTDNLLAAIGAAKGQPLSRVLCALGVRGTGRSMSRRIARYFATMDHIRAADAEAMQRVEGIGTEKAPSIVAELANSPPSSTSSPRPGST